MLALCKNLEEHKIRRLLLSASPSSLWDFHLRSQLLTLNLLQLPYFLPYEIIFTCLPKGS